MNFNFRKINNRNMAPDVSGTLICSLIFIARLFVGTVLPDVAAGRGIVTSSGPISSIEDHHEF
jgi:hypothetical protein